MLRRVSSMVIECFNPRPREGATDLGMPAGHSAMVFQSTPPRRGRLRPGVMEVRQSMFQSTPPRRGRPLEAVGTQPQRMFQSTPPRRGRRVRHRDDHDAYEVSIHAPAKGATCADQRQMLRDRRFNPRPRAGGDAWPLRTRGSPSHVSIHAPARGRQSMRARLPSARVSIHAPARGRRLVDQMLEHRHIEFQSTPPRGGRPMAADNRDCDCRCFNPRPREGATTSMSTMLSTMTSVSIHAPAQGATTSHVAHRLAA